MSDVPNATKWVDELRGDDPDTDVEPIGEIVEAHGLIAVSIPEMPPVGTKLYAAPPIPDGYDKAIEDALNYGQGFVKVQHVPLDEVIDHDKEPEWDHPPHRNCECKHCKEYWSDVYGDEPVAWGMANPDGQILDVICPKEHDQAEGEYTVPLYTAPFNPRKGDLCGND